MYRLSTRTIVNFVLALIWFVCAFIDIHTEARYASVIYKFFASAVFTIIGIYCLLIDFGKIKPMPMKKEKWIAIIFIAVIIVVAFVIMGNYSVVTNKFNIKSEKIPESFDDFRIVQVSDLHNAKFDKYNSTILEPVFNAKPDIIVITGDLIDSRRTNINRAVHLADRLVKIAPTYYVNGNHEARLSDSEYNHLTTRLEQAGVTILENDSVDITIENETITLIGINDSSFGMEEYVDDTMVQNVSNQLMSILPDNDNYKVLLAHKPHYFDAYANQVDLVLSGHAHGGQFRIPFVGGLVAPGQGFFPEYYEGSYIKDNTEMIVSRGIGNSIIPFRINNKPEIVVAELTKIED